MGSSWKDLCSLVIWSALLLILKYCFDLSIENALNVNKDKDQLGCGSKSKTGCLTWNQRSGNGGKWMDLGIIFYSRNEKVDYMWPENMIDGFFWICLVISVEILKIKCKVLFWKVKVIVIGSLLVNLILEVVSLAVWNSKLIKKNYSKFWKRKIHLKKRKIFI